MIIPINLTMTFDSIPDDIGIRELDSNEEIQFTDVNVPTLVIFGCAAVVTVAAVLAVVAVVAEPAEVA